MTALNKKPSIYSSEDAQYLARLSKACLLDLLVEQLRLAHGAGDTPLTVEQVQEAILPTVSARGDRLPRANSRACEDSHGSPSACASVAQIRTNEETAMTFTTKQGKVPLPVATDNRSAFGIFYFDSEEDANEAAARVRAAGRTYNGGWFHGMPCGRDQGFDRIVSGKKQYAVTY